MEISPQDSLSILSALSSSVARPDLHDILQQSVRRNAVVGHRISEERSELFSKAALDAVACMCVDKPEGQSVAVSYSHHPDSVYVWVATNSTGGESTPEALETYIHSIWDILASAQRAKELSESLALLLEFSGLVYRRCFRRIYHRVSKYHADFLAVAEHARTMDPPPKKEYLDFLDVVQEIIVMLRELCRIDKALPDGTWLLVAKLMTSLYTVTSPSAFKIFLAVGFEESETYHNQNERKNKQPFSLTQYIHTLMEIQLRIDVLFDISAAPRTCAIFKKKLRVIIVQPPPFIGPTRHSRETLSRCLRSAYDSVHTDTEKGDVESRLSETTSNFLNTIMNHEDAASSQGHCPESILLLYHHNQNNDLTPYPYLGTSAPPCYGCVVFFDTYNSVVTRDMRWCTRRTHHRVRPWCLPGNFVIQNGIEKNSKVTDARIQQGFLHTVKYAVGSIIQRVNQPPSLSLPLEEEGSKEGLCTSIKIRRGTSEQPNQPIKLAVKLASKEKEG
ncbi:uncharacterized protein BT62DRAFT_1009730 [Guyanagaster necrorhizus]|uniref:Uncharacterized protein n=1 Tax=Guyanagaster necrorhizus TaxID=856835 RepID=A0A9P8APU2_9AGAR|nr:uncharacterized protein BT62DRAFT_1009730 [Guyanagaster necrorhizus MCA 3950]KAG7443121.1 hypothetical protein BT62DRAFT_1009730 [Guyanagaster necrorhizus MCA 3950]